MKASSFISLPVLICALVSVTVTTAQTVVIPIAPTFPVQAGETQNGSAKKRQPPASSIGSAYSPALPLWRRGVVSLLPHFLYRLLHADGLLNVDRRENASSVIQTIAPGARIEIGNDWAFDYTYGKSYYSNPVFKDEVTHDAILNGRRSMDKLSVGIAQSYGRNEPTLVETARQTKQESYSTELTASYRMGVHTRLEFSGNRSTRNVDQSTYDPQWAIADWTSWATTDSIIYEVSNRLNVGAGITLGYDSVNPGSDMIYNQPHVRGMWSPTDKIALEARLGYEDRRFTTRQVDNLRNPVYSASIQYSPLAVTRLFLAASRSSSASYFVNSTVKSTGWRVGFDQRLVHKLFFNATVARMQTRYLPTEPTFQPGRRDINRSLGLRLSMPFLQRGSVAFLYQNGHNNSTLNEYSFDSQQYGVEISYRF